MPDAAWAAIGSIVVALIGAAAAIIIARDRRAMALLAARVTETEKLHAICQEENRDLKREVDKQGRQLFEFLKEAHDQSKRQ